MNKLYLTLICCILRTAIFAQWGDEHKPLTQSVSPPTLPSTASFCDERIPLEYFDVAEALQREMNSLCYWHSSMIYTIQLSRRYMPTIERIIKESGLPDDLKFISVAESNLQNVVSPAKAAGFWQFMTSTAKEYGLEVNAEVDERYHLEKATRAACRYFREAYSRYGSWATAAASYNAGMGYINNQTELQKTSNYYDLALNQETSRYVYRTVAYKLIMQSPESYGFAVSPSDYPPLRYREVKVKGSVNWIDFAIENGTNYKLLRYFNPWIRDRKLTNKLGKSYTVKIPERR